MYMKRHLLILQILLCCVLGIKAQKLIVNAPSRVSAGENFRLTYTVSTQNVSDFRIGNVPEALEIITGPYKSSQSSFQMINGHTSSTSSVTYTFILCALKMAVIQYLQLMLLLMERNWRLNQLK